MKTTLLSTLTAATLLAGALTANARNWETILQLSDTNNTSIGNAVMIDPFSPNPLLPDLFLGGRSSSGPVLHLDQSTAVVTAMVILI